MRKLNSWYSSTFTLNGKQIEQMQKFKYLGSLINAQLDLGEECKIRIEMDEKEFIKFPQCLQTKVC